MDRLSNTSKRVFAQFLALEIALDQAIGRFTGSNGIGLSKCLDARTDAGNLTQCQVFVPPCSTHFTNHNQPCMDTHTDSELDTFLLLKTGIEVSHGSKNSQTSPYCSLRIVFMGLRIAEID